MNAGPSIDRRGFLLLSAGLLLVGGCADAPSTTGAPAAERSTDRAPRSAPTAGQTGSRAPSTSETLPSGAGGLPAVTVWTPNPADVLPDVKLRAARVVEALGTWGPGKAGRAAAAARLRELGVDDGVLTEALPLLGAAPAAALEVLQAQYGGILPGSVSVLVVCRQWRGRPDGPARSGGTTVDVRLRAAPREWAVTQVRANDPGPPSPVLSTPARDVLRSARIELPPAARADVMSGAVHDSVLTALLRLSTAYRIGVSVIRSGHPLHVFGTTRLSDHSQGRAFDTYRINGRLVVDRATPRGLVTGYMRAAVRAGSLNVGGPYLPPGGGGAFFSDATHHDHVHAGFST